MQIKKVFVCPHGDSILQPQRIEAYAKQNQELHDSMVKVAQEIDEISPDLIFYITPHNAALYENHCIFLNTEAFGRVEPPSGEIQQINQFKAQVEIDSEISLQMVEYLRSKKQKVEGLTSYASSCPFTLAWGEVVPLCISGRRQEVANEMVGEMQSIGNDIYDFIDKNVPKDKKIVVINSCDLAHTFKIEDGPDVGQEPYGVSPTAQPFDDFIYQWANYPTQEKSLKYLYYDAAEIVMDALSCGYCGLVLISGIFNRFVGNQIEFKDKSKIILNQEQLEQQKQKQQNINLILPKIYSICHPTYFGMMVATFQLQGYDIQKEEQQNCQMI